MSTLSLAWSPLIPLGALAGLGGLAALLLLLGLWRRAPGVGWRFLAWVALAAALAGPRVVSEEREPLPDIAVAVVDRSASQSIGERESRTDAALAALRKTLDGRDDIELRVVEVGPGGLAGRDAGGKPVDGTHLFSALDQAMADVPRRRFAGAIFITDGQVHDAPEAGAGFDPGGPVHTLITGDRANRDRRLTIVKAPSYTIVGNRAMIELRVDDMPGGVGEGGGDGPAYARVTVRRNGTETVRTLNAPLGAPISVAVPVDRAGPSVFEVEVEEGPQELTLDNNRAVVAINGIRDRLRVLLVSGQPHPGERTWRNLLKADPSVDLVHFTILRPPDKQDGTPVRELSLIAFPIRELFEIKLHDFDLIIFDNYERRGVLPLFYLANIADYVRSGGALLEAVGPSFATPLSLYNTPLVEVLPAEPTGEVFEEGFKPTVTETGARHPVTAALTGAPAKPGEEPAWGRWFRQIDALPRSGKVLMEGARGRPLLVLDRVGEGRVAQLMSDQIWLWARNFEGGGPHAELLRRLSHWLMKEPSLEEDRLSAALPARGVMEITRRSLEPEDDPVEVTFPSGRVETVTLEDRGDGSSVGTLNVDEAGLYRLADATRTALAAVGSLNPLEFRDVAATGARMAPAAEATGGGIVWLADDGMPDVRRTPRGRSMAGAAGFGPWIGLQQNNEYVVRGVSEIPILPSLALLLLGLGALILAWRREGR